MFSISILLAILGAAMVGVSMTMAPSSKTAMLGIILGGVLLQAGIILFVLGLGRERARPRRRRYEMRTAT
jgi:hypothetical protein